MSLCACVCVYVYVCVCVCVCMRVYDEEAKKERYLHFQNFSDDKGKLIFSGVTLHSNLAKHASQTLEVLGIYLTSILKNYQTLIFSRMPRHFFSFKILKVEIPLFFCLLVICVYVCVCMRVYACVCVYVRVYVYVCMPMYVCVCICMCVCMYVCVYMCLCMCVYACVCVYVRMCMCVRACVCMRVKIACVYMRMYVYACMCVYACVYVGTCVWCACLHVHTCVYVRIWKIFFWGVTNFAWFKKIKVLEFLRFLHQNNVILCLHRTLCIIKMRKWSDYARMCDVYAKIW